jgi:hypothetical protein
MMEEDLQRCVESENEDLGCNTPDLSKNNSPLELEWEFSEGSLDIGDEFMACFQVALNQQKERMGQKKSLNASRYQHLQMMAFLVEEKRKYIHHIYKTYKG